MTEDRFAKTRSALAAHRGWTCDLKGGHSGNDAALAELDKTEEERAKLLGLCHTRIAEAKESTEGMDRLLRMGAMGALKIADMSDAKIKAFSEVLSALGEGPT